MINFLHKPNYTFEDLVEITKILRCDEGCPWDRVQTHESVRMNFIEEVYEACEAIDNGDLDLLKEELGDVLAQVVFHSQIEDEKGNFNVDDVADGVCKKFIERHPHIFGQVKADTAEEVLSNWDDIKRTQKGHSTHFQAMDSVARSLPALMRAEKLQSKARKAGFDWEDASDAFAKVTEELEELKDAMKDENSEHIAEEAGDLLFAVVNVIRLLKINPELSLDRANEKFLRRFGAMEKLIAADGKEMSDMQLPELDAYWERVKKFEEADGK